MQTRNEPRLCAFALLLCLTAIACAGTTAEPVFTAESALTAEPVLMCTTFPCWDDETHFCPGECPGGCGVICATLTPDPNAAPTPTFPAPSIHCTLPTPGPATSSPALYACASATTVGMGETVGLHAQVTNAMNAQFTVQGRDTDGTQSFYVEAMPTNRTRGWYSSGTTFDLVSVQVSDSRLYAELRALAPGIVQIEISAGPPYPSLRADPLTITVHP
jgi:hypothetical protein